MAVLWYKQQNVTSGEVMHTHTNMLSNEANLVVIVPAPRGLQIDTEQSANLKTINVALTRPIFSFWLSFDTRVTRVLTVAVTDSQH